MGGAGLCQKARVFGREHPEPIKRMCVVGRVAPQPVPAPDALAHTPRASARPALSTQPLRGGDSLKLHNCNQFTDTGFAARAAPTSTPSTSILLPQLLQPNAQAGAQRCVALLLVFVLLLPCPSRTGFGVLAAGGRGGGAVRRGAWRWFGGWYLRFDTQKGVGSCGV